MVEHAQEVEQIIKVIEDKVNAAKLEGNRPEAARLQNKINELQDYLHGNNGAKILVDLSEFDFQIDAEEDNQSDEVENAQMLDDLKAAFQREDYETCFDLVTRFSKQDANIELVNQYGENALYIKGVSELILESGAYAAQNNWKDAIQVLEKMNSKNLYPEDPFTISKEIREKAENLLFDYNKKFYEAKFEGEEKKEEELHSDVSSQNLEDVDDQVQVQESVEDISFPVTSDDDLENVNITVNTLSDSELLSDKERAEKIDQLMAEAIIADSEKKYTDANKLLSEILCLDESHIGAIEFLELIEEKRSELENENKKIEIQGDIERTEKVNDLKALVYDLEMLVNQNPEDEKYKELFEAANKKYNITTIVQGNTTTTAAQMGNYYLLVEALSTIDESIRKGESHWYDDRINNIRPIYEVRNEFIDRLPILADELCKRLLSRAEHFILNDPKTAIFHLTEANKLEGIEAELKEKITIKLADANENLRRWKIASTIIEESIEITDPFTRLEKLKEAEKEYEYHPLLGAHIKFTSKSVLIILESNINKAMYQAKSHLIHDEFQFARDVIQKHIEKTNIIDQKSRNLQDLLNKAYIFLGEIDQLEDRRHRISEKARYISEQVENKNFELAKKAYLEMPSNWRSDSAIAELRVFIDHLISNEERIASAQTHFENGNWNACIEECKKIGEEGALQEKIRFWRVTSQINIYKQQVSQYWSKELYLDAEQVLQTLFSMPELSGKQEDDLRDEYAVYLKTIEELKLNDPAIAGKLADAEKAKENNQLLLAYDTYSQLMEVNSTRKGFIRQQKESIEKTLHDDLIKKLEASLKKKDFGKAYEFAETINQRHLFWGEDERTLRANAVLSYVQQVTSELAKDNNWQAVIDEWEKAAREFPNELVIITELRITRRNKLIFDCERNLDKFNYAAVLCDIDESRIDLRDDLEIANLYRLAQILQEAEDMIARQEFTGLQNFLTAQQNTNEHPVIQKYKEQKTKEIVVSLVQSGDELMNKGEITAALNHYTIALNMEPQNITAQGRVQKHLPEVRSEVRNLLDSAEQYSPGFVSVQEKLDEGIKIFESLKNFRSVVTYFDDENTDFNRKIHIAIPEMEAQLGKLEQARKIIERYGETSEHWKAILRQGNWNQLDEDVRSLAQLLSIHHPQYLEINNRKRIAIEQRKALGDILTSAKHAYDEENFDLAITAITEALQINSQIQRDDNLDPFGLIAEKATVYDFYKKQEVSGLEPLMELIEDKKIDHDKWKRWSEKVNAMSELLNNSWNEIDNTWPKGNVYGYDTSNPTKMGIDAIVLCEKRHEEITHVYDNEIPATGPLSGRARLLKKQAIDMKSDIEKSQEQLSMLKRAYEESSTFVDFDNLSIRAQDLIQQAAYIEAMEVIKTGLSYDPENQLFHYLEDICFNQLNKPKGLIGKIFGQH